MYQEGAAQIKRGRALAGPPSPGGGHRTYCVVVAFETAARSWQQTMFQPQPGEISMACARRDAAARATYRPEWANAFPSRAVPEPLLYSFAYGDRAGGSRRAPRTQGSRQSEGHRHARARA